MKKSIWLHLPETMAGQHLFQEICRRYSTMITGAVTSERLYMDTFDWRLYRAGLALYRADDTVHLIEIQTLKERISTRYAADRRLRFSWDIPDGPLQEVVGPLLNIRALLALARVVVQSTTMAIRNNDGKSGVHLTFLDCHLPGKNSAASFTSVAVTPLRGYPQEAAGVLKFLAGLGLASSDRPVVEMIYTAARYLPCSYTTKLRTQLAPRQPLSLAAVAIFQDQLAIMRQNEAVAGLKMPE